MTDAEWAVIEPLLPPPSRRRRSPKWTKRQLLDAIFYVLRGGIAWSLMPKDLPPKSTVFDWFYVLRIGCGFEKLNFALVAMDRERTGARRRPRPPSSTARASRPPRAAAGVAMTPARRSTAASATR